MKTGYLTLETHPEHQGMVRVMVKDELPNTQDGSYGSHVRYIARFNDIEAGQMHLHNMMHNQLVDLDNHIYRIDLNRAIAAIEADDLNHARVWIDPSLSDSDRSQIDQQASRFKLRHKRWNTFWLFVGGFFIVLFFVMSTIGHI
ncbi:MAG: hypothetical protein AB2593_11025 [Candidatus Thiodiazotropha sp.]|nr:hypothetical protein [Candidatus Thiodiazotropha sp. (ex Codakia orbicularis)]PUB78616.1 MAG: hypothetical protein DBP03_00995 [gamma proteobacterium symbiont of Ctena orbiculata]PUB79314.1 MAG: hypothetical protein DBO99_04155 [gamma proteobacterium symbiont of Ctena orbiculata]